MARAYGLRPRLWPLPQPIDIRRIALPFYHAIINNNDNIEEITYEFQQETMIDFSYTHRQICPSLTYKPP